MTDSITSGTKVLEIGGMIAALKRCATQKRTCSELPLLVHSACQISSIHIQQSTRDEAGGF